MMETRPAAHITNILCPSDLSELSQKALGFAARLAETSHATLTACHCISAKWLNAENRLPEKDLQGIKSALREQICNCQHGHAKLVWRKIVVENSFEPSRDILNIAREVKADLIVMKARPGVLSAFRFGSIVKRIIEGSPCPILLLPSNFLATHDPRVKDLEFRRVLFDYDFTEATDELFRLANGLAQSYHAELQVLSVLEPVTHPRTEIAPTVTSRTQIQTIVRRKLDDVLHKQGDPVMGVPTSVEWGRHASTVLEHAKAHRIDLICTTLPTPHFYFEKYYSSYLGRLLRSAGCPLLVKRSATEKIKDL